jgi:hypothetical protein
MGFHELIVKVQQAETALEAQERQASADWRQLKASWRALWTPGRIVLAGVVSGFAVGRVQPLRRAASGGGLLQLLTALSGMFAGTSAQAAADTAAEVGAAAGVTPDVSIAPGATVTPINEGPRDVAAAERRYREAGLP